MSRLNIGNIAVRKEIKYNADLLTVVVINSPSGPKGWVKIDDRLDLDLYFKDSNYYDSLRILVDNKIPLIVACTNSDSNESTPPYQFIRLFNHPQITHLQLDRGMKIDENDPTVDFEGSYVDLVDGEYATLKKNITSADLNKGWTYSYLLDRPLNEGEYLSLPTDDRLILIYRGNQPNITLNEFSLLVNLTTGSLSEILTKLEPYQNRGIYAYHPMVGDSRDQSKIYIHTSSPHKVQLYSNIESFRSDPVEDRRLLMKTLENYKMMDINSKVLGPRLEDLTLEFISMNSDESILRINMDNYSESFRVSKNVDSPYWIEDSVDSSKIISIYLYDYITEIPEIKMEFLPTSSIGSVASYSELIEDLPEELTYYLLVVDNPEWSVQLVDLLPEDSFILTNEDSNYLKGRSILIPSSMIGSLEGDLHNWVYPILWIYSQEFLGDLSENLVDESNSIFEQDQYSTYMDKLLSLENKDLISKLIVAAFKIRMKRYLSLLISKDSDYESQILGWINQCMFYCPLIDKVNLTEVDASRLNQVKVKMNLKLKKYSTGNINLNFSINL